MKGASNIPPSSPQRGCWRPMTHLPPALWQSQSVPFEWNLYSIQLLQHSWGKGGRTREGFRKQMEPQTPSFCPCYCSGFGPGTTVSIPCFSLSWFVWQNPLINTKLWGQSHLTRKRGELGRRSAFCGRGDSGSHWTAIDNGRKRYGPDNFFFTNVWI